MHTIGIVQAAVDRFRVCLQPLIAPNVKPAVRSGPRSLGSIHIELIPWEMELSIRTEAKSLGAGTYA